MVFNLIFFNRCFDKNRLKALISWYLANFGEKSTLELLEKLKDLGFEYATKAGISLGVDDLKIPPTKAWLVSQAEVEITGSQNDYSRGSLTVVENFQQMIDTWHKTSETLRHNVVQYFKSTDLLNPVYMMAFSGARGNISQVRQLVGMRGLMADPQGQIIDFPIKSNFREGLTLTEYVISCYGARKGLVDTALRTANSGYLTRRLVDVSQHVIVRQLDCGTRRGILLNDMKEGRKIIYSLEKRLVGRVLAENIEKIAFRNQDISPDLSSKIVKIKKQVLVRSPLTCEAKNSICQLCYGWSLAHGNLVSLGEAVGILAAQSIGEPGTQLTMRTFHTGGVFSGDVLDEIRSPFDGIVQFSDVLQGTLIRTSHGKIAFLTKMEGDFFISNKEKNLQVKYSIPSSSILFVRQGEKVIERQLLVEFSSMSTQTNQRLQAKYNLSSPIEGQVYFEDVILGVKVTKEGDITRIARKLGSLWILSGKMYQGILPSNIYPKVGDLINQKSIMNQSHLIIPFDGTIQPVFKQNLINKIFSEKQIHANFKKLKEKKSKQSFLSSLTKSQKELYFLNKFDVNKKSQHKLQKNSFSKNFQLNNHKLKDLFLNQLFLRLDLNKIQYKKIGYFLSVFNIKKEYDRFFISNSLKNINKDLQSINLQWFPNHYKTDNAGLSYFNQNYISEDFSYGFFFWVSEKFYQIKAKNLFLDKNIIFNKQSPENINQFKKVSWIQIQKPILYITNFRGLKSPIVLNGTGIVRTSIFSKNQKIDLINLDFISSFEDQSKFDFAYSSNKNENTTLLGGNLKKQKQNNICFLKNPRQKHRINSLYINHSKSFNFDNSLTYDYKTLNQYKTFGYNKCLLPLKKIKDEKNLFSNQTVFLKTKTKFDFSNSLINPDKNYSQGIKSFYKINLKREFKQKLKSNSFFVNLSFKSGWVYLSKDKNQAIKNHKNFLMPGENKIDTLIFDQQPIYCECIDNTLLKNNIFVGKRSFASSLDEGNKQNSELKIIFFKNIKTKLNQPNDVYSSLEKTTNSKVFQSKNIDKYYLNNQSNHATKIVYLKKRKLFSSENFKKFFLSNTKKISTRKVSNSFQKNYFAENRNLINHKSSVLNNFHVNINNSQKLNGVKQSFKDLLNTEISGINEINSINRQGNGMNNIDSIKHQLESFKKSVNTPKKNLDFSSNNFYFKSETNIFNENKNKKEFNVFEKFTSYTIKISGSEKKFFKVKTKYNKSSIFLVDYENYQLDERIIILFQKVTEYPLINSKKIKNKIFQNSVDFKKLNQFLLLNKQKISRLLSPGMGVELKIQPTYVSEYYSFSNEKKLLKNQFDFLKTFKKPTCLIEFLISFVISNNFPLKNPQIALTYNRFLVFSVNRKLQLSDYMINQLEKQQYIQPSSTKLLVFDKKNVLSKTPFTFTSFFSPYQGEITSIKTDFFGKQNCLILTKQDQVSFINSQSYKNVENFEKNQNSNFIKSKVGQLIRYGDEINFNCAVTESGQVIQVDKNKVTLRKSHPILFSSRGIFHVHHGDFVEKNTLLLTLFYQRLKTGDIVQGIPKIEELFEARQTKEGETLPENLHDKLHEFFEYYKKHCNSQQAARKSISKIQQILVDGVQRVYQSQGVTIADKHLEIVVRQMTSKVKILEGGQTGLLRGELIDLEWIEVVNLGIEAQNEILNQGVETQKAEYEPVILGITKASLETESFISAASFQETTRILSRAAIDRKTDFLRGLKENVILGHLIPAGTGFSLSFDPQIKVSGVLMKLSWLNYTDIAKIFSKKENQNEN